MKTERRQKIHTILQTKPFVSLKELSEIFPDVTSMTLRRDIEYFEQQGELIKVRNGARSMKFIMATADENYNRREKENESAKKAIANVAKNYFEKGKCHFLDSGSTIVQLSTVIPDDVMNLVTPCPNVSMRVIEKSNPIVTLIGGILNRESLSVTGDMSLAALENIDIDTAFVVPSGYSAEAGFTCGNYSECELKKYVVKKAKKVIMLIDSSKYEKTLPYSFCSLKDIDIIITDADSGRFKSAAENAGVTFITTEKPVIREHSSRCIPVEV